MNQLHLKYQQETGNQVQRDINLIQNHSDFKHLYDYIKWLEELIEEQECLIKIAADLIPDTKDKVKIKFFENHSNHYYGKNNNK